MREVLDMRKRGLVTAGMALITAVYIILVLLFLGFSGHGLPFWFSFAAELFSLVFGTLVFFLIAEEENKLRRALVLGYPFARWTVIYMALELVVSTVFLILDRYEKAAIAIQLIILVVFLILLLMSRFARNAIVDVQDERRERQFAMKDLAEEAAMIASSDLPDDLRAAVQSLADDFKYSDTMSAPETAAAEEKLLEGLAALKRLCRNDPDAAMDKVKELEALLDRRNVLARSSKRRY